MAFSRASGILRPLYTVASHAGSSVEGIAGGGQVKQTYRCIDQIL